MEQLKEKYGEDIPNEERQRVLDTTDLDLYNLPNDKLLADINAFFEKAIAQ